MKRTQRKSYIYSYSPAGLVRYEIVDRYPDSFAISYPQSIFTRLVRKREIDAGQYFYTTRARAIEAFIEQAKVALADTTRAASHDDWREALLEAQDIK